MSTPKNSNPIVENVRAVFDAIPAKGKKYKQKGYCHVGTTVQSHVQGMALYSNQFGDFIILTHNNKGYSKGKFITMHVGHDSTNCHDTPYEHYNHPGGMQVIGDFVAVALENSSYDSGYVLFYSLFNMTDKREPTLLNTQIRRESKGSGAAGITYINGTFIVGVTDSGELDVYLSNSVPSLDDPNIKWSGPLSIKGLKGGDNIALASDSLGNVYLFGFRTEDLGGSNKDYIDLYKVDLSSLTLDHIESRHMYTKGGALGALGVHFRYGAGIQIIDSATINLCASERNFEWEGPGPTAFCIYYNKFEKGNGEAEGVDEIDEN
ncbi:hypothetical protein A3860_30440 [Niastella vici]|uniref:Uncharacterized protein n=1 Tax=Niastella vici TaxID=1703345 RepID=A0A1V9FUG8_9BACT|nr:hypothetical protein [Niastella vici]OQP62005.1 hypothetical protein A3860_30440 [Niastella vici]